MHKKKSETTGFKEEMKKTLKKERAKENALLNSEEAY